MKQPTPWSCLPTAFANLLHVDVDDIFKCVGHDGSDILWPDQVDPWNRRSFHLQEMITYCLTANYAVTTVTPTLGITSYDDDDVMLIRNDAIFEHYMCYYNGVLTGKTDTGWPHAVTWRSRIATDPTTGLELKNTMMYSKFHIVTKIV